MGIVDAIKKGFGAATRNPVLILILFVFNLIWNIINISIVPVGMLPVPGAAAATPPVLPPQVALATLAVSIIFILISIFMQGGSLGVIRDYIKEGKAKLGSFASYGLKYYLRLLGLGILIILIVLIVAVIAALIVAATTPLNNVIATVIAAIIAVAIGLVGIYFVILLVMSPYILISEEVGVIESMKRSIAAVRKSFWRVLSLLFLLILIAIGIGFLLGVGAGILTVALPAKTGQIAIGVVNSLFNGYFGVVMMAAFMVLYFSITGRSKA